MGVVIKGVKGRETRSRGRSEAIPVHLCLRLWPSGHEVLGGVINDQHPGLGTLDDAADFVRGETPVDRVGNKAKFGAGTVQIEVREMILGQDADTLPLLQSKSGKSRGQGLDTGQKLAKGETTLLMNNGRLLSKDSGI